ncbi:MAG: DUF3108 domain-containing protein, partial [Candidatus Zixiibacteriota bacterium]
GIVILGIVGLVFVSDIMNGIASAQADKLEDATGIDRHVENIAFGPGEKLTFDIGYGFINAGTATLEVVDLIEYNERPCHQIVTTARSNKFFSSFYKVEDRVESLIDAIGIFSWRFEKNLSEGSYRSVKVCEFDQENNLVHYEDSTYDVGRYVQDALSAMYYVRTQDLNVGVSIFIDNFTDGKHYPLEVKVLKKETINIKAGKFDCLVVEPLLQSSGIFQHEERLTVWLTDDRLKLPVLMKSRVLVGSISAELTDYKLGEIIDF